MFKKMITLLLLVTSFTSYAAETRKERRIANRLEKTLPEPRPVETHSMYKLHMGLSFGMYNPNGDIESSPEYGINVGFQPYIPFGLGLEVTTTEVDDTDLQRTSVLARGTYNFGGDIPVLKSAYVGLVAGPTFQSDDQDTELSVGPTMGFDVPLSDATNGVFSLGANAKYLYTTDIQDSFSLGLALKYWY